MSTATPQRRWQGWQAAPPASRYLSDATRNQGYTVVWVPKLHRATFLDVVQLLHRHAQAEKGHLLGWQERTAVKAWAILTRDLADTLTATCAGREAHSPGLLLSQEVVYAPGEP